MNTIPAKKVITPQQFARPLTNDELKTVSGGMQKNVDQPVWPPKIKV